MSAAITQSLLAGLVQGAAVGCKYVPGIAQSLNVLEILSLHVPCHALYHMQELIREA